MGKSCFQSSDTDVVGRGLVFLITLQPIFAVSAVQGHFGGDSVMVDNAVNLVFKLLIVFF